MGRADYYEEGDWNAACYRCGRKRKASTLRRQWQGFYVCPEHWEPRNAQDFVRGVEEHPAPPWAQDPPKYEYRMTCDPNAMTALPNKAVPGCAIPGYISPSFYPDAL